MRDILLAAILLVLAVVSFLRPFLGVLSWTWVSYFSPNQFTWGWSRRIPGGEVIAIPTLLGLLMTPERRMPPLTRETFLLIILWIWFGVTTLNVFHSPILEHHLADTTAQFLQVSKTLFMTFIAMVLLTDKNKLRWWCSGDRGLLHRAFFERCDLGGLDRRRIPRLWPRPIHDWRQ